MRLFRVQWEKGCKNLEINLFLKVLFYLISNNSQSENIWKKVLPTSQQTTNIPSTPFLLDTSGTDRQSLMLSRVQLFVTPWAAAHQAPMNLGFSRQD